MHLQMQAARMGGGGGGKASRHRQRNWPLLSKGGPALGSQQRLGAAWILPGYQPAEYLVVNTRSAVRYQGLCGRLAILLRSVSPVFSNLLKFMKVFTMTSHAPERYNTRQ